MSFTYENKTIKELKEMCRMNNITSYSKLNKIDLIKLYKKNMKGKSKNLEIINYKENLIKGCNKKKIVSKKMKGGVEFIANNESLREAVNMWCDDTRHEEALEKYGPINDWDTSAITNMERLFENKMYFNEDISKWNTKAVTNMEAMFYLAHEFNQLIGDWVTSAVNNMGDMFLEAYDFNQSIGEWDTSAVTNMRNMFAGATSFNQPINDWHTSAVTNMGNMFDNALSFNQPINTWNISAVINRENMFKKCPISEKNKPNFFVENQNLVRYVNNNNNNNNNNNTKPHNIYTITHFINSGTYKEVYNLSRINNNAYLNARKENKLVGFKLTINSNDLNSKKNYAYISIKLKDIPDIIKYNLSKNLSKLVNNELIKGLNTIYQNYLQEIELQKKLYKFDDLKNNINNIFSNGFNYYDIGINNVNYYNKKYIIYIILDDLDLFCIIYNITEDYFDCIILNIDNEGISFNKKIRIKKNDILNISIVDLYFISEFCTSFGLNNNINKNIDFEELLINYENIIFKLLEKDYIYIDAKLENICYKKSNNNNIIITLLDIDPTFTYKLELLDFGIYYKHKKNFLFIISYLVFLLNFIIYNKNESRIKNTYEICRKKIITNINKFTKILHNFNQDLRSQITDFINMIKFISENPKNNLIHTPYEVYSWYICRKKNEKIETIVSTIMKYLSQNFNENDN